MPAESTFYPRVFALVVAALLGYALVLIFTPFFAAMCWAAFLAFLLHPLNLRLRRRLRGKAARGRPADHPDADHHPAAVERAVDRIRGADFRAAAEAAARRAQLDIKTFSDLQHFPLSPASTRGCRRMPESPRARFNRG